MSTLALAVESVSDTLAYASVCTDMKQLTLTGSLLVQQGTANRCKETGLLGFWALSIVLQSEELDRPRLQVIKWETHTLLGLLERANLSHWVCFRPQVKRWGGTYSVRSVRKS
jgi:hypothetical protein